MEKKLLAGLQEEAALKKIPIIDVITGRFLEVICLLTGPKNILEIGCGNGFSSYFLVKNLKDGYYTGIDLNHDRVKRAEEFIRSKFPEKQFKFLTGNALKLIPELQCNFDLVFIDAAKYEYPRYIKTLENKLDSGALIIADNIFYKNKIFKKETGRHDLKSVNGIKEYISYVTNSDSFSSYFFDIGDGISVTKFVNYH
ncbi:MAG: methyltransferase domain-containing protein [Candidatus Hydromicrobium sp.]